MCLKLTTVTFFNVWTVGDVTNLVQYIFVVITIILVHMYAHMISTIKYV